MTKVSRIKHAAKKRQGELSETTRKARKTKILSEQKRVGKWVLGTVDNFVSALGISQNCRSRREVTIQTNLFYMSPSSLTSDDDEGLNRAVEEAEASAKAEAGTSSRSVSSHFLLTPTDIHLEFLLLGYASRHVHHDGSRHVQPQQPMYF